MIVEKFQNHCSIFGAEIVVIEFVLYNLILVKMMTLFVLGAISSTTKFRSLVYFFEI